jgi:NAD-dependent dihydropyrimidine dehydrogenase PreA subunit
MPAVLAAAARSSHNVEADGIASVGEIEIIPSVNYPKIINHQRCSGCGCCIAACPEKLYTLESVNFRKHSVNKFPEKCGNCGKCVLSCPLEIILGQSIVP